MNYSFFRALRYAFKDFGRNFWLSLVTITVLILALLSVNILISLNALSDRVITAVKEKVDISVFIKADVEQAQVANFEAKLKKRPEVKEVIFVSKDAALADFKEQHKDDPRILEAIKEVEKNPLADTLIVKAKSIEDYKQILNFINLEENQDIIKYQNYTDHEKIIARVNDISKKAEEVSLIISLVFAIIAILIIFNAIRVSVYTRREEVAVMRLVGASSSFIRLPFLLESVIYGVFAVIITFAILYAAFSAISPYLNVLLNNYSFNLVEYYNQNFVMLFAAEAGAVILLSVLSSAVALGRYLKV
ncbi:MAG: hypothetical protein UT32_C0012G0020 [Parcubacteria group bacterium GW2011_GWC2_39_14]|nr:MAG: hypothetical protein UT32_C0012G0020 [Parcubacteria group bacterium GW2011_GWC2_39_14]KKR55191.1 MAG: hypothetical protein UT91_C0004G0090 [Parcubacteria group bacterium GW2011_GWA2_40_23]